MKLGKISIKGESKNIAPEGVKRNIAIFSWIPALFFCAIGLYIGFKFLAINQYYPATVWAVLSIFLIYPLKILTYNSSIKRAKKRYGELLKDLVVVQMNKRRIFALSGLTLSASILLFLCFMIFVVPNIDIVQADRVVLGAHRGNSHDFIENTLPAFESAVKEDKYQFIEFDIQYTKDKVLVVHHGPVYNVKFREIDYYVEDLTYEELVEISEYHVPTYEEVMKVIGGKKPLNIEIKSQGIVEDDLEIADYIVQDTIDREIKGSTLFSSISDHVVQYVEETCVDCETGKIMFVRQNTFFQLDAFNKRIMDQFLESGADYLMLHSSQIRNYRSLKQILPEGKNLVFWYLFIDEGREDEMYVVEPSEDSWIFLLGQEARAQYSPEKSCFWWCGGKA